MNNYTRAQTSMHLFEYVYIILKYNGSTKLCFVWEKGVFVGRNSKGELSKIVHKENINISKFSTH